MSKLDIVSVKIKAFPIVGRPLGTRWRGKDQGLGILRMLNSQRALNAYLTRMYGEVRISARPAEKCWTLTVVIGTTGSIVFGLWSLLIYSTYPVLQVPTRWDILCYQAVARRLLRTKID